MSYGYLPPGSSQPYSSDQLTNTMGTYPHHGNFNNSYIPYPNLGVPPPPVHPYQVGNSHTLIEQSNNYNHWNQNPMPCSPHFEQNVMGSNTQYGMGAGDEDNNSESDGIWVQRYLAKIGKYNKPILNCNKRSDILKISVAQESVNSSLRIVRDLKTLENKLTENINLLSTEEWEEICSIIASKKAILMENIKKLSAPSVVNNLQRAVSNRQKKRQRQKRRRNLLKKMKSCARQQRQQLHKDIDGWLQEMQLTVEKVKAEESLKRQADLVLADVTRKQVEARRQVTLLSMLVKLRQLRVQAASSRGERVSAEQVTIFENVADKLKTFWSDQLKGYNVEETGLRVMLEEETQEQKSSVSHQESIFNEWQRLLFGRNTNALNPYLVAEQNLESFIDVRRDWDKFAIHIQAPMASSIPIGWVLPGKPSSKEWAKLLNTQSVN